LKPFNQEQLTQKLRQILSDRQIPSIFTPGSCHYFSSLASTNQTLWEMLAQGAGAGTIVIAEHQTAGRGQWGRQWQSQPGGLYLSVALHPNLLAQHGGELTLCSAWGLTLALRHAQIPVQIKWPNDLILDGKKLGGILTETKVSHGLITQAVIGVGINGHNPVPNVGITLQQYFRDHPAIEDYAHKLESLAAIVLSGLALGYSTWQEQGIDPILADYPALLSHMGQIVEIEGQSGIVTGVARNGNLRIELQTHVGSEFDRDITLAPGSIQLGYQQ
jgi:BirA family transcriptional regulator, biotin operon repressor / biotin---[acetyl-CoA-carboxylase] ligase